MGLDRYVSTQSAILIGSAMIAGALYFGLRQRSSVPSDDLRPQGQKGAATALGSAAQPAPERAPAQVAPLTASAASRLAPTAPPPAAPREEVVQHVLKALEAHRAILVARCWAPAAARNPKPETIRYVFDIGFNAAGKQTGRGILEDRATARPDVTSCVSASLPPLEIPAPNVPVQVEVPFSLP